VAERSVVMDAELRYFEVSVPGVEVCLREGIVKPVLAHYGGEFAHANIYKPAGERTLEAVRLMLGSDALGEIQVARRPT
jgi:hypothetical protein